ncbi:hypothetical protein SADUNF_Sadunf08G0073500 [Salix dunnii]|uniref:Uncharacterized protein n=1 Tax=Salix dunnii TaxID=1413687 RepID=A0A835N165_9ROSI|nr:hypothetical protein SADUNF_Sadunf08G0073500 [Salix dunnii]
MGSGLIRNKTIDLGNLWLHLSKAQEAICVEKLLSQAHCLSTTSTKRYHFLKGFFGNLCLHDISFSQRFRVESRDNYKNMGPETLVFQWTRHSMRGKERKKQGS